MRLSSWLTRVAKAAVVPCRLLRGSEAVAIAEFALSLPLLLVLVVGVFDFGGAFNLKQKLEAVAQEGARFGAASPTNDLTSTPPSSVTAIRDQVDSYLTIAKINDCGLPTSGTASPTLVWTFTGTCPGGGTFTLTIDRGNNASFPPAVVSGVRINVISTQVTLAYPYHWQFNRVIGLLVPGATYAGISTITTTAVVPNQD